MSDPQRNIKLKKVKSVLPGGIPEYLRNICVSKVVKMKSSVLRFSNFVHLKSNATKQDCQAHL